MTLGENIRRYRKLRGLTQHELARLANMSRSYLADVEHDRYNPSVDVLETLADALQVSTDTLLGRSLKAIVEARIQELRMSWADLSRRTGIPVSTLQNLDAMMPNPWDYEDGGLLDKLAHALSLDRALLASAFARQEPPVYDGPRASAENAFGQNHVLSPKEERDIARDLERIMASLESDTALAFDGEPLTEEDRELLRLSLENSLRLARQMAKKKFAPKNRTK